MQINGRFTIILYPFLHNIEHNRGALRLKKLEKRWLPWWQRLEGHEATSDNRAVETALDDTYFFLPSIRELLFPETALLGEKRIAHSSAQRDIMLSQVMLEPSANIAKQAERLQKIIRQPVSQMAQALSKDGVLRLTLDPNEVRALHPLRLKFERPDAPEDHFDAAFEIDWIDVALFPSHVGFLLFKVSTCEEDITVSKLSDFLYYMRQVQPFSTGFTLPNWQLRNGTNDAFDVLASDVIDSLLQGFVPGTEAPTKSLIEQLQNVVTSKSPVEESPPKPTQSQLAQIYGQSFRLYTYACLTEPPEESPSDETSGSLFASPVEQALYELATCTDTSSPDYQPHPHGMAELMERGHIALWKNWQGMALHDNVVFLGQTPRGFAGRGLAHNVESDYLNLYLLTLYQKIRLSFLSLEMTRREVDLHRNRKKARTLWANLLLFRSHFWFSEVTLKPQGTTLYHHFQRGLGLQPLYDSIETELRDLQDHYERKTERHLAAALNVLAFIGLPLGISSQLFSKEIAGFLYTVFGGKHGNSTLTIGCSIALLMLPTYIWWKIISKE